MTDAAAIGTALQLAAPLVSELARAIAAGLDERAAVERAIERWRAVAPPVAAEVTTRIDRIAAPAEERAATDARVSHADLAVIARMLRGPYPTTEERASLERLTRWAGARMAGAIPIPPVLISDTDHPPPGQSEEP